MPHSRDRSEGSQPLAIREWSGPPSGGPVMKRLADATGSLVAASVGMALVAILPTVIAATPDGATVYPYWIDDIKDAIAFYRGDAYYKKEYPNAQWHLYVRQILEVETAYQMGDVLATYVTMNRFMDMLQAREGAIPAQPANELFNLCNFVVPPQFHDVDSHAGPPRMEQPKMPEGAEWPR